MCPHDQMRREVGYMRPALFRRIIDQAAPELEFAYLHHLGESLFHGQLGELIRYAKGRGVGLGLSTNATYLTRRKGEALLRSGLDFLVISLDGASPDAYLRMRPGGDFSSTLANVQGFLAMRGARAQPQVAVQMIVTEHNRGEVRAFAQTWEGRALVMIKEARDWAGQVQVPAAGLRPRAQAREQRPVCRMPWTEMTVLWDGLVVPCANVYERQNVLGDLRVQTVDEVWNGAAMQALRRAHLQGQAGKVPVCATCTGHEFEHGEFVRTDQLTQRLRHYDGGGDLRPRPGLS
jgi:radical SAM protein with 4Fe4S-binding SPASM domain